MEILIAGRMLVGKAAAVAEWFDDVTYTDGNSIDYSIVPSVSKSR